MKKIYNPPIGSLGGIGLYTNLAVWSNLMLDLPNFLMRSSWPEMWKAEAAETKRAAATKYFMVTKDKNDCWMKVNSDFYL